MKMAIENICLHNKYGFCKFRDTCRKRHVAEKCEKVNCEIENCLERHPRECRFFRKFGRCKFTDFCFYEHKIDDNLNDDFMTDLTSVKAKLVEVEKILENKENRMEKIITEQNEAIATLITALNKKAVEIANLEKKVNISRK